MKDTVNMSQVIDEERSGDPVTAHGYTVTPVATVKGRYGNIPSDEEPNPSGSGQFGWASMRPVRMRVTAPDGTVSETLLGSEEQRAIRSMVLIAAIVAIAGLLLPLIVKMLRPCCDGEGCKGC